jgi:hypothetical protein
MRGFSPSGSWLNNDYESPYKHDKMYYYEQ